MGFARHAEETLHNGRFHRFGPTAARAHQGALHVLKNINQDRLAALSAANHFNQNNTAYPVFLHDAEAGWALITQQTYPIELLLGAPDYFRNCVRALPRVVIEYRKVVAEKWELEGQPWAWTSEDQDALLSRSML
jgi:hypothetical protein